jgi:ribosome biogenesis GTPase
MKLEDLGFTQEFEDHRSRSNLEDLETGRVIAEHKERYLVRTPDGEFQSELIGNLRFSARQRSDFPAVGDWVAISVYDTDKALIHSVYPRKNFLERQAVGKTGEKQLIAVNLDFALIVQAVDRDLSINRMERYLTICRTAKVQPMILLNKIDLITETELDSHLQTISKRIGAVTVHLTSNETGQGISELNEQMIPGKTYCLLGSSGVGKSSLLNRLAGEEIMKTRSISDYSERGKHVTTHRELFLMKNGAILIDNPGMREVGIADAGEGLSETFMEIAELANHCKFKDCSHTTETGCAILQAVEKGEIDRENWRHFIKLEKEKAHFEQSSQERRKKDKGFGILVRNMKKFRTDKDF